MVLTNIIMMCFLAKLGWDHIFFFYYLFFFIYYYYFYPVYC